MVLGRQIVPDVNVREIPKNLVSLLLAHGGLDERIERGGDRIVRLVKQGLVGEDVEGFFDDDVAQARTRPRVDHGVVLVDALHAARVGHDRENVGGHLAEDRLFRSEVRLRLQTGENHLPGT